MRYELLVKNRNIGTMTKSERLKALLSTGYFPRELPPMFTTADFAKYRKAIGDEWKKKNSYPKTSPERFNIPKANYWLRELSIVNPIAQYHVAKLIADNWCTIKKHLTSCSFSVEDVTIQLNQSRAVSTPDFSRVFSRHSEISAIYNHAVLADISRFYGTLYTHAIPWCLHGKEWVKSNLNNTNFHSMCGSQLDSAIRKGQDNQSIGIPVGPDTSRIIAEIVAVSIDTQVKKELRLSADSIVRNVDDWYIGFDNVGQAEKAIAVLAATARDYGLEIHPEKTKIINASTQVEPIWPTVLRQSTISSKNSDQAKMIDHYFAQAFYYAAKYKEQNVLRFAVKFLRSINIFKANWHQFETYLLKAVRSNRTTIPAVVQILAHYNSKGFLIGKGRVSKLIKDIIEKSVISANHYEIAWILCLAKTLEIIIPVDWVKPITRLESSVCALVLLDLQQMNLIDGELDISPWTNIMTAKGLESNMWLLAYEADLKGWASPPKAGFVQKHSFFSALRKKNVSFYNPSLNVQGSKPHIKTDITDHKISLEEMELFEENYGGY